jgi:hypothetical protein
MRKIVRVEHWEDNNEGAGTASEQGNGALNDETTASK